MTSDVTVASVVTVNDRWDPCLLLIVTYFKSREAKMSFAYSLWIKAIFALTSPTDINVPPRSAMVRETKDSFASLTGYKFQ